jgi:ABC-type bacteriocin/lantibiotic exporter with double-glycine peptidase domain
MLSAITGAFGLVDIKSRWLVVYLTANFFAAMLEASGLALLFVFFQVALDPANFGGLKQLEAAYGWLGNPPLRNFLSALSIAVIFLFLLRSGVLLANIWIAASLRKQLQFQLAPRLFLAYLKQPYIWHLRKGSTRLVNNVSQHAGGVIQHLIIASLDIVSASVTLMIFLGTAVALAPIGTAIVVVAFAGLGTTFYFLLRVRLVSWGGRLIVVTDKLYVATREAFRGIKIIKVHQLEARFSSTVESCINEQMSLMLRNSLAQQAPRIVFEVALISGVLLAVSLAFGVGGNTTEIVPAMALFGAIGIRIMPHITKILGHIQSFQLFIPALDAIRDDLRETSLQPLCESKPEMQVPFSRIELKNVSFAYAQAEQPTLDRCSLILARGDRLAITGLSGAGKTTLVDVLLGLIHHTHGDIYLNDHAVTQLPFPLFSYVPQESFTVRGTLRENIALGVMNPDEAAIQSAVDRSALRHTVDQLPNGLNTMMNEDGAGLSGGERQRLGIARALYRNAPILVMDEPTSSLDVLSEADISAAIDGLGPDKTVIVIAHRLSTIKHFPRIIVMETGKIIAEGNFADLYRQSMQFRSLVDALSLRAASTPTG